MDHTAPAIYLGHGASGSAATMQAHIDGLRKRGLDAAAVQLPVGKAERAVEAYRRQVRSSADAVIGGHSFGGRVASLLAAQEVPRGLILLSYPLHRPGHPEQLRVEHWPQIRCPVLLLSGESDPFARIDLLRAALVHLAVAELVTYPHVGHGLGRVLDDVLDRTAAFVAALR